jgi:VanZ family protein
VITNTASHSTRSVRRTDQHSSAPTAPGHAPSKGPARFARVRARTAVGLWLPPLALMALIFFFSDQPHLHTNLGLIDFVGRKIVHFLEYAVLAWLWCRAFTGSGALALRTSAVVAVLLASAYAASDEYHQTFVPGRAGTVRDWLIDTAGALVGAAVWLRRRAEAGRAAARVSAR